MRYLNLPGALALGASCQTLHELDVNVTHQRIAERQEKLRESLRTYGFYDVLDDKVCPAQTAWSNAQPCS